MKVFAEPAWLYAGLFATVMAGAFLWWAERRKIQRLEDFAASKLLPGLSGNRSGRKATMRCILLAIIILLLFATIARPQWGSHQRKTAPTGIDVLVALDVSRSMLARDIRPNRIERVKLGLSNLLDKVKGDRIGLIAFAGSSFLQCPLTLDHSAVRRTLREMNVGVIKRQGTDFALPIEEAMKSFSRDDHDRFLIIISDGEDLERRGLRRAKKAAKDGVRIYTIGIGNKEGARIPLDDFDKPARNFLKDINGKAVLTKMDEANLVDIAKATGGKYYSLGPTGEGLVKVVEELQAIGQQKRHALLTEELPIERYQVFLLLAVLLLLGEFLLGNRRRLHELGSGAALLLVFILSGCLRKDNVKQAEEAHENKDYTQAAAFYEAELNATLAANNQADPRLYLNAGLAHLEASNLTQAKTFLEKALDETLDLPDLQSTILNALGNLHYAEANLALDAQDVISARKAWGEALDNYNAAMSLNGNPKAEQNRENLRQQLEERIEALISRISGIVWRDIDGNGRPKGNEPRLAAKVYWDKDGDGDHNATSEPFVETDPLGRYNIEWISGSYPVSFQLGCVLLENNATAGVTLVPILPPPPLPRNPKTIKTQQVNLPKASERKILFPYRAAPILKGFLWSDNNQNGKRDENETGYTNATLFLDLDGGLALDENETAFKPSDTGAFSQAVPPGQHVLSIRVESEKATITFPREEAKAHLTFVDFETAAEHLDFGVHAPNEQNQSDAESDPENGEGEPQPNNPENQEQDTTAQNQQFNAPQEVNALYERLLQEAEANAESLDPEGRIVEDNLKGRDY